MYTTAQIKSKFLTYLDEFYTGYWNDTQLTDIFQKAVANIIEQKLEFEGSSDKISDELTPLRREITGSGNSISFSTSEFKKLDTLRANYGHGLRPVTPYKGNEGGSQYSQGTERWPKYMTLNDAGTLKVLIYPDTVANYDLIYYKNPLVADGTDVDFSAPTYTVKYTNKLVELIIDEAVKIAGQIIREQEIQVSSQTNEMLNQ